ncbi:MAG: hypothetical protein IJN94_07870 [Clostridia bacterium]|nr:hypothetical protein [Clostridia bacterium]
MKKKILIVVLIIVSVFVIGIVGVEARYRYYHGGSPSGKGWYAEETVESNGEFVLKTNLYEADDIEFMSFCIENKKGEVVFDSNGGWRTWDLHGIRFADDTNDVIVDSGDIGEIIYEYNGKTWTCEEYESEEIEVSVEQTLPWKNWN